MQCQSANAAGLKIRIPYVLAFKSACARAEDETMLVQRSRIVSQPSLGLESVYIWVENILVVPYKLGIRADITTSGDLRSRYLEAIHW